jgi:nucleoside-diphosphate-sugar epimerase
MKSVHAVLGAGGGIGGALVRSLVDRGLPVRAVSRRGNVALPSGVDPDRVDQAAADVTDAARLDDVLAGAAVVYHAAQPRYSRWAAEFPAMTTAIAEATTRAAAKLVLADNLYMYGPIEGPLTETSPTRPRSTKGKVRLAMADDLLERHARGDLRVAIGRASDYYGPGGLDYALGRHLFEAAIRVKKARWLADPDVLHTEHFLDDLAQGLVVLGTSDRADGEVWHLPAAPPMTGRGFIELVDRVAGHEPHFTVTSRGMIRLVGLFDRDIGALAEVMDQWDRPFTSDASKFRSAFAGFVVTPHEDAVERTVAWFRRRRGTRS